MMRCFRASVVAHLEAHQLGIVLALACVGILLGLFGLVPPFILAARLLIEYGLGNFG